ncbi:NAD binding domain [Trypanosoma vivax]|uniref:6-phosphogluconate dehydrogenase, decarboxylating n=1 Tax=Trypanosoma vivax (strain Y486) TaxID=1055687 RepID=G0U398_TRYVY|nr:6-phosphogluconate dehydrogenase, decarboxylating [Trypanosoma vivax]KAH8604336.1 NAD binding domain [Trypanosoma vivax]CCC50754.1 putative 6-phosphogluconate dehydrogenase,decarboxylating [Trypanosoma vivax Y486]
MSMDVGIVGLGVMGANLALNIAEKGFKVAVFNRTYAKSEEFMKANASAPFATSLQAFETMKAFADSLKKPRKVLILVQAGVATDSTIEQLKTVLDKGDIIVDTGNAHFKDQTRRAEQLEAVGLRFLGMGISGGEEGARKGPAFFPGGTLSVWEEIRSIIEAAAAKADDGRPCVTMNGRGGAGSCVKMYHNAGEYAILQIWGEAFDILRSVGLSNEETAVVFEDWKSKGFLKSYMLDISIAAARAKEKDGSYLIEHVKDCIGSKGTGLWSAQEALEVGVPAPSLNMAVVSRQLTMYKSERLTNADAFPNIVKAPGFIVKDKSPNGAEIKQLYDAVCIAIIACYAQMFQCLRELDKVYSFGLNLPATIATFRAGCILQGYLLKPMTEAFENNPNISNLMCAFETEITSGLANYREIVALVTSRTSLAIPVLSSSLQYVNAMFTPVLRYGQLVSLQRDVFGRHGYERLDKEGRESHQWEEMQ